MGPQHVWDFLSTTVPSWGKTKAETIQSIPGYVHTALAHIILTQSAARNQLSNAVIGNMRHEAKNRSYDLQKYAYTFANPLTKWSKQIFTSQPTDRIVGSILWITIP